MIPTKVYQFLALAFGLSWGVFGLSQWTGLIDDPMWGLLLLGLMYMWGPAAAVLILQKGIYKSSLVEYGLDMKRGLNGRWFLYSVLTPIALLLGTFLVIFVLGNLSHIPGFGRIIISQDGVMQQMAMIAAERGVELGDSLPFIYELSGWVILLIILVVGLIAGVTINLLFAFGEELGWRGLMLEETRHLGFWKSNALIGAVWGLWHAPLILYADLNYPGYGAEGIVMMMAFCISLSFPMAYLARKTGNILSPSGFHGVLNGVAGAILLYIHDANPLFGNIAGLAGIIALSIITYGIWLGDKEFFESYTELSYLDDEED